MVLQALPFVHRHFSLPVAGTAGLKSLGESAQYIQFPIAILADTISFNSFAISK